MDPNFKTLQLRGLLLWAVFVLFLIGLGSIIPDWLINLFLGLVGLALLAPILGVFALRWWIQRNVVQGECPVCSASLSGLRTSAQTEIQCPSCGTTLRISQGRFERSAPPGVIDVQGVEVVSSSDEP